MKLKWVSGLMLGATLVAFAPKAEAAEWGACWRYVESRPDACELVDDHRTYCGRSNELRVFGNIARGFPKEFFFFPGRNCP